MYRHIPNLVTLARLALTVVFFTLLNWHDVHTFQRMMWIAFAVFLLAVLTDWLDGYLARRWHAESAFGRVVDPFVDKIMICGAFIFFASDDFLNEAQKLFGEEPGPPKYMSYVTGVRPWMAVVLVGREFLITGIRGLAEARGIDFRADWAGKAKMFVQCVAVGSILVYVATIGRYRWVLYVRDIAIWTTLVVTVLSATGYISRSRKLLDE